MSHLVTGNGITRREAVRASLAFGSVLIAGGAAGCGSGSSAPSSAATTSAVANTGGKPGGTLRLGITGGSTDSIDAHIGSGGGASSVAYSQQLYEGLMQLDHHYQPQLALAEELAPAPDAMSWTTRLRSGLTFHDGKPVTADDVIFTIRRILNPKNGADGANLLSSIDPHNLKKVDSRTVRIGLKTPDVSLDTAFALNVNGIVPVGYDPKKPVGAGPFKLGSFAPTQRVTFDKFADYWRPSRPYLDEVVFVVFSDPTAIANAIQGGAVDGAGSLSPQQFQLAQQNTNMNVIESKASGFEAIAMRCDKGLLADVRVREAFRLIADRKQLIEQVYSGRGTVGNDLAAPFDALYASDIEQREPDIEKAKSLLKAAGASGLTIPFYTRPELPVLVPAAEVFAQQAKAAGVNVQIKVISDVGEWYSKYWGKTDLQQEYYFASSLWKIVGYAMLPTSPYNSTHWTNRDAASLFLKARGSVDLDKRKSLAEQAQKIVWEQQGWLLWGFKNTLNALSKKFTGMVDDWGGNGINSSHLWDISIA